MRFLHTADWQIGLRVRFIPGDAGAVVRDARLRTVRRIGDVARERDVAFVVVAGDVFEHHGLKPSTVRRTFDALSDYPCPVYLLPGNHDPYTPESLYRSSLWASECPANVQVLGDREPLIGPEGVCLLPCPLLERHTLDDPTSHLTPDLGAPGAIRVAVAHGGVREILERLDEDGAPLANALSLDAIERGRLDYLALGDWHGQLQLTERAWYSGAPEATRFKEKDPGHVLVVDIEAPGAVPKVESVSVATQTWTQISHTLDGPEDLEALSSTLSALPNKPDTLVELFLSGTIEAAMRQHLEEEVLGRAADRLQWLRVRDDDLHELLGDEALDEIASEGWVKEVVQALREPGPEVAPADADQALRLLYRLHRSVER